MKQIEIHQPETQHEICSSLMKYKDSAILHAGGTDMLVRLRNGLVNPACIIDLSKVDSLKSIEILSNGGVLIGAMVTISTLSSHSVIKSKYQALQEALQSIGSLQIRNRGTLVGNICNASPAADSVPPLLTFDAKANIRGCNGVRSISVEDLITGPGETILAPDEFVESVELPESNCNCSSAYMKIGRRRAVDCSIVGVAVRLGIDKNVRVAFGAVAAKPIRAHGIEKILSKRKWDQNLIEHAATHVHSEIMPINDIRASKEYRQDMSVVLFKKVFDMANQRLAEGA